MPNSSNVKVQLKTVSSIEGYSVPAYPITKWECIGVDLPQSRVVAGTTHYVGGIVSSGNSLWFDRSAQQIPTSADVVNIGDLRYCPLSNVVDDVTQYANLYVTGATAIIINSNGNAGDGNIPTPEYSVIQAITAPYGSRNIPSEQAVGEALETKQHILSAGSCIGITAGGVADTIYVSATRTVAPYGQAVHTQVPTEAAVRDALSATSYNLSNYAYALTDALHTTIINSGYATANWVDSNFIHSGDSPAVEIPYGSYGRAGIVQFVNGSGLTVADDQGTVKLTIAGPSVLGGVMVPANSGLVLNTATGALTAANAAAGVAGVVKVGTGLAMSSSVAGGAADTLYILNTDGKRVSAGSGISVDSSVDSYTVSLLSATSTSLGGVYVPANGGLRLQNGALSVVYDGPFKVVYAGANRYNISGGAIYNKTTGYLLVDISGFNEIEGHDPSGGLYLHLFWDSGWEAEITRSITTTDAGHYFVLLAYVDSTNYAAASIVQLQQGDIQLDMSTMQSAPMTSTYASAYTYIDAGKLGGVVVMTSIEDGTAYANYPVVPTVDAVYQAIQAASGGGGTGGYTTISEGTGITIAGAPVTGYTVYLKSATSTTQTGALLGGVKVLSGSGIKLTNGAIAIDAATSEHLGGVYIPNSKGLSLGATGSLTLSSAPVVAAYSTAETYANDKNIGGVVVMSEVLSAIGTQSSLPVVPTVDAVYNNVSATSSSLSSSIDAVSAYVDIVSANTYHGPFSASYTDSTVTLAGGYVNTKDSVISAGTMSVANVPSGTNTLIYMSCASGYKCKKIAVPVVNGGTYSIVVAGTTYGRTTSTDSAECWSSGEARLYTSAGLLPQSNIDVYSDSSLTTVAGKVSSYLYNMHVVVSANGATESSSTYYEPTLEPYDSANPDTKITAPFYLWNPVDSSIGAPAGLGTRVAFDPIGHWISAWEDTTVNASATPMPVSKYVFDTADNIPLAEIHSGGTVRQLQYGNIIYRSNPPVYHGDFSIQKMEEEGTFDSAVSVTYFTSSGDLCERYRLVTARYVQVGQETWGLAGLIYGVPIGQTGQWCLRDPIVFSSGTDIVDVTSTNALSGTGAWVHDIAIEYPLFNGLVSSGSAVATSYTDGDCLYIPSDSAITQIWLNIYKGINNSFPGVCWHVQLDSRCLENIGSTQNRYSVLLANVINGKVEQVQSGAIDIRGRWA